MKFQKNSVIFRVPVAPRVFTRASQKILCVLCVSVVNLLFAAGADDLAPRLSGAAYSLDIGQNTSTYLFHADHTWEEHYKFAVKAGAWRQTAPDTFSIGAYTFTLAPDTSALRRSDNKIWRRAAPAPVAVADPAAPNLIPATPSHASPNYWCTWWSQVDGKRDPALRSLISAATANAPSFDGDQGDPSQRDGLNEKLLFHDAPFPPNPASPSGWVSDFAAARADLFLLLDDGWDVPYGLDSAKSRAPFGSCIPDATRFPAAAAASTGSPVERLKKLNQLAIAAGWRGLGLWIAVQKQGETGTPLPPTFDPPASPNSDNPAIGTASLAEFSDYWRERILWCRDAGILYWKADWGVHNHDPAYRRAMTELARQLHPALVIEHAVCMPPMNGLAWDKTAGKLTGTGRFSGNPERYLGEARATLAFAQVLRTYDIVGPTIKPTTLDRAAWMLQTAAAQNSPVLINMEDMVAEAAALSCTFGAMRSRRSNRKNELLAAVRWARVAPALPANALPVAASEKLLTDTSDFTRLNHWYKTTAGKKGVWQKAPAVIARGLPLPKVTSAAGGALPYVAATLHTNGSLAVATIARAPANARDPLPTPLADIEVPANPINRKTALFGPFRTVTFRLDLPAGAATGTGKKLRVWAQNLAAPENSPAALHATDITDAVQITPTRLAIPFDALRPVIARSSAADISMPAVILQVEHAD